MDHLEPNHAARGFRAGDLVTHPQVGLRRVARTKDDDTLVLIRDDGVTFCAPSSECRLAPPVQIQVDDLPLDIRVDDGVPGLSEDDFVERFRHDLARSIDQNIVARLVYRAAVARHSPDRVRRSCDLCGEVIDGDLALVDPSSAGSMGTRTIAVGSWTHYCPLPDEPGFGAFVVDANGVGWTRSGIDPRPFVREGGDRASWRELCSTGPVDVRFNPEASA